MNCHLLKANVIQLKSYDIFTQRCNEAKVQRKQLCGFASYETLREIFFNKMAELKTRAIEGLKIALIYIIINFF